MNPDVNLMYPKTCALGVTWFECPRELLPGTKVCSKCHAGMPGQMELPPTEAQKATVANILTAPERLSKKDMVNLPEHYARYKIEPIRFIVENDLNWFQGNILKYMLRYDAKNGMEDVEKGERYYAMFKLWVAGDPDWWRHPEDREKVNPLLEEELNVGR